MTGLWRWLRHPVNVSRPRGGGRSHGPRGRSAPPPKGGGCAMGLPAILAICTRRLVTGRWPA